MTKVSTIKKSVGHCTSLIIDSGAHTLYTKYVLPKRGMPIDQQYSWFKSKTFDRYVDSYVEFIRKYEDVIDFYVTLDAIYNPELSWEILKRLEGHGVHPMPVIHSKTNLKWVDKYLEAGYDQIGLGGLGQSTTAGVYREWANKVFDRICDQPSRLPLVKVHGFAMTSWDLMTRYPWFSVDSTSCQQYPGYGWIIVPPQKQGKWRFDVTFDVIGISRKSRFREVFGRYKNQETLLERRVLDWLEFIDVPLGKSDKDGNRIELGVINNFHERSEACIKYFIHLQKHIPEWPWPFPKPRQKARFKGW